MSSAPELSSELAVGRFERVRRAGVGGSGEVWLARDRQSGDLVALKVATQEESRAVLAREAWHAALAISPLLPELVDVGVLEDGEAFLALRWIEGSTLEVAPTDDATLALRVARDVAEALGDLHALGLAHGDVKPANLVCCADGRVRLLDLGLASSAWERDVAGATPRYLARGDADLGDARARDLAALGVVIAELLSAEVAGSELPIQAARAAALPGPAGGIVAALLAPNPSARPPAAWVSGSACAALGDGGDPASDGERAARLVRATYLSVRRDELRGASGARHDTAPWLAEAVSRAARASALSPQGGDRAGGSETELGPLPPEKLAQWLTALAGAAAAAWPLAPFASLTERAVAATLVALARRTAPRAWTYRELESALLGGPGAASDRSSATGEPGAVLSVAGSARLALSLAEVPPHPLALEEVERRPDAPLPLVLAAADALRLSGALGRARSLVMRSTVAQASSAHALAAEIFRRAGDLELATARARQALDDGDPDGRARAMLARLALDGGRLDEAAALTEGAATAPVCEVAALCASARGDLTRALAEVARGEALAHTAEQRARLRAVVGYALHATDPGRAREAFAAAVDHAVRAGAVVEEATYRTGEAAAAVDLGDIGTGIATSRRAALLWEHLGRPAMAARALLACAAGYVAAGAALEATRVARDAIARAREGADRRAEAYAWWAIADVSPTGSPEGIDAAARAAAIVAPAAATMTEAPASAPISNDELRAGARLLRHRPEALTPARVAALDVHAAGSSGASVAARLEWWGARASDPTLREPSSDDGRARMVLTALTALAEARCEVAARGPALAAGCDLAARIGSGETAQRLLVALADAGRELLRRAPPELADSVRALPWVVRAAAAPESGIRPEQARDLESLVRSLSERERLGPLLDRVVDALVLWTGVERGLLLLRAPDGRLSARAARNLARADLVGEQVALSHTLARRAMEQREPVVAMDAAGELPSVHQSVHALKLRSVLAVPLIARGEVLGVVYLDDRVRRGAFGERELAWARSIASLAALAIADARDQVLLRRAARKARRASAELGETLARREAALDAAQRELAEARAARSTRFRYDDIVGESDAIRAMLRVVDRVTTSEVPVLLMGESGSGKELVARAIHGNGSRGGRPFVSENCGAIPEGLLESALFGHVRGAFTGADRPRVGLFEAADQGTLFLDEIGEMSLPMQTKLLRVLEDGVVRPLGSERTRRVDVRVITATHRDLEAMVRAKAFREDLLYRLNIITLRVPPLRERPGDVPLIVQQLVKKHAQGVKLKVTRAAMERLSSYPWPGNVRQLENEIRRAIVLSDGVIDREHLSADVAASGPAAREAGLNVRRRIDALETELCREALERTKGNQTKAATLLGLSRFGLQKMIKRLRVE